MSIHNPLRRLLLVFGLSLSATAPAMSQGLPNNVSEPEFVPYVEDLQLFEQPDLSPYGRGVRPPEGWFGSVEYLNLSVGAPGNSTLGNTNVQLQEVYGLNSSTINTGTGTTATNTGPLGVNFPGTTASGSLPGVAPGTLINGLNQFNTNDITLQSDFTSGSRFEFGRINDGRGWMVSTFTLGTQTQNEDLTNVSINFANQPRGFVDVHGPNVVPTPQTVNNAFFIGDGYDDDLDGDGIYGRHGRDRGTPQGANFQNPLDGIPDRENAGGPDVPVDYDDAVVLPTVYSKVFVTNKTGVWGVEAMKLWRLPFSPRGGVWELFAGPRYLNIDDSYYVEGLSDNRNPQYWLNPLGDTRFNTEAENNIVGGQFGGRWSYQRDRWQFSTETRLFAAANFQNIRQNGGYGSLANTVVPTPGIGGNAFVPFRDDLINMQVPASFQSQLNAVEFTPAAELRFNLKYQVFRSVYLQLGYTALYADGIARASRMVNYTLPGMGINPDQNKDGIFMNGVNFGVIINR